jgi:hypothetical protein
MQRLIPLSAVLLTLASAVPAQNAATSNKRPAKTVELTGCVSAMVNAEGNYSFTNGHYKKAVELIPGPATEDISTHAGHEVELTGRWIPEPSAAKSTDGHKYEKHFEVASIQHKSDTCPTGSGTTTPK